MACYDCEDCSRNISYGGKCKRFEYDCPFGIVAKYDSEKLSKIREATRSISAAIENLKELDNKEYMEEETNGITFQLSLLEDKISEDIEKEWKEIQ